MEGDRRCEIEPIIGTSVRAWKRTGGRIFALLRRGRWNDFRKKQHRPSAQVVLVSSEGEADIEQAGRGWLAISPVEMFRKRRNAPPGILNLRAATQRALNQTVRLRHRNPVPHLPAARVSYRKGILVPTAG